MNPWNLELSHPTREVQELQILTGQCKSIQFICPLSLFGNSMANIILLGTKSQNTIVRKLWTSSGKSKS